MIKMAAVIQARMGANRLPGKVLLPLGRDTVLGHVVRRISKARWIDRVIVATTVQPADDAIERYCQSNRIDLFRGSENDVLDRYHQTVNKYDVENVIRITADCPLIDPGLVDAMIEIFNQGKSEFVTNVGLQSHQRTFPRGLDAEIFSRKLLDDAHQKANSHYQREHVTPFFYENYRNIFYYKSLKDFSNMRWTLDTSEDWSFIQAVYAELDIEKDKLTWKDIATFMEKNPSIGKLNQHVVQKKLK